MVIALVCTAAVAQAVRAQRAGDAIDRLVPRWVAAVLSFGVLLLVLPLPQGPSGALLILVLFLGMYVVAVSQLVAVGAAERADAPEGPSTTEGASMTGRRGPDGHDGGRGRPGQTGGPDRRA